LKEARVANDNRSAPERLRRRFRRRESETLIITIDGPAGAGKSTTARRLANSLGFCFLDTGAMYRAVALAVLERDLDPTDAAACERVAGQTEIRLEGGRVYLDGRDCTDAVRRPDVTSATRHVASHAAVRERLVRQQRAAAEGKNVVTEGRDQGTVVFPEADCKFYLTADPRVRAGRRRADLAQRGQVLPLETVLAEQEDRDARDRNRAVGPLAAAHDALHVDTSDLSPDEVVERLEQIVRERIKQGSKADDKRSNPNG
jgi:cytidylate kinase